MFSLPTLSPWRSPSQPQKADVTQRTEASQSIFLSFLMKFGVLQGKPAFGKEHAFPNLKFNLTWENETAFPI